jgi:hypothetical protein
MRAGDLVRWGTPVEDTTASDAMPMVGATAHARDALTVLLTSPARTIVVVDAAERRLAVVTLETIAAALSAPRAAASPPSPTGLTGAALLQPGGDGGKGEP